MIGQLPSGFVAVDMNNSGQVLGYYGPLSDVSRQGTAYVWHEGTMTKLASTEIQLNPVETFHTTRHYVQGINDAGTVVGFHYIATPTSGSISIPAIWSASTGATTPLQLEDLGGGIASARTYGINNSGRIVGSGPFPQVAGQPQEGGPRTWTGTSLDPPNHAFKGINPHYTFHFISGNGTIYGVSSNVGWGIVVGNSMVPLNPISAEKIVREVNNTGKAAGFISGVGAVVWDGTTLESLSLPEGRPYTDAIGLNDLGAVVGYASPFAFSARRATLWDNGEIIDLNTRIEPESSISAPLLWAKHITNSGHILAAIDNGSEWYLLAPTVVSKPDLLVRAMDADSEFAIDNEYQTTLASGNQLVQRSVGAGTTTIYRNPSAL